MINIDSLSLKYFALENERFISGSIVQKIQQINRYELILIVRNIDLKIQKKLYININPKYPHICFLDDIGYKKRDITIPKKPPAFCMQLRKYLNGSKIKQFRLIQYERIIELYFDYFNEIGSLTPICLAIELMGKHSNIILYNVSNKTILGSIHNISEDKSSIRVVFGGAKYIYPPLKEKLDILNVSFATFSRIDEKLISEKFYYFSKQLLDNILNKFSEKQELFSFLQSLEKGDEKDFLISFWQGKNTIDEAINNYYSNLMFEDIIKNKKTKLKKYLSSDYKKLKKTTSFPPDIKKQDKYKLFGDLIMANMYIIKDKQNFIEIDNNKIELDTNLSLNQNAQKYYSLYKKEKVANEYKFDRFNKAKDELDYLENIIFSIDMANSFDELIEIKDEIIELGLIDDKKENIKTEPFKLEYKGFEIYLGKNNKQNDYLISKIADGEDLWFHGANFPSSHVILKLPNNKKDPSSDVLEFCARLVKQNSKAKFSGKVSIIYTKRKNLKKPPNTYLGYVTYKNEKEIVIN